MLCANNQVLYKWVVQPGVFCLIYLVLFQSACCHSGDSDEEAFQSEKTPAVEEIDQHTAELLRKKWEVNFKYIDYNKDKIINEEDVNIEVNVLSQLYSVEGPEKDKVKEQLKNLFNCLTFNELEMGISKKKLVAQILQSYGRNKDQTVQHIRHCVDIMVDLLDHDKDGFVSVDELTVIYKGQNMPNKYLIRARYRMICPETPAQCPLQNFSNAWTELLIGDNEETFLAVKHIYEEIGIPFEELVE